MPNCRSGGQEWLFMSPDVCLVTMALLQSIVIQNMCFYGHNADQCHVPSISVAEQLKRTVLTISLSQQMSYSFPFQFSFVQSMLHYGLNSRLWIQQVCAFTHELLAALEHLQACIAKPTFHLLPSWLIG